MARTKRIKIDGEAYYHVISRVANKAFLFKDARRKRCLRDILYRAAEFSGIDIGTYVIMDNHIHLCVHVPLRAEVGETEVLRRIGVLYGERRRESFEARLSEMRLSGRMADAECELGRLRARIGDLSEFMKTFKQRVSQWFNGEFGHEGTLWAGRFKSVLVEDGAYLRVMAHYIHQNPVRAGISQRAEDYEWSALGAATHGDARAVKGLSLLGIDRAGRVETLGVRDRRFSNGVIVGSRGFVRRMAGLLIGGLRGQIDRIMVFRYVKTDMFSSHGQRSTPQAA